jgi:hypothetical protein
VELRCLVKPPRFDDVLYVAVLAFKIIDLKCFMGVARGRLDLKELFTQVKYLGFADIIVSEKSNSPIERFMSRSPF